MFIEIMWQAYEHEKNRFPKSILTVDEAENPDISYGGQESSFWIKVRVRKENFLWSVCEAAELEVRLGKSFDCSVFGFDGDEDPADVKKVLAMAYIRIRTLNREVRNGISALKKTRTGWFAKSEDILRIKGTRILMERAIEVPPRR